MSRRYQDLDYEYELIRQEAEAESNLRAEGEAALEQALSEFERELDSAPPITTCGGSIPVEVMLRNFVDIPFRVPTGCRTASVRLNSMWVNSGCQEGPTTYSVTIRGPQFPWIKFPSGTQGITDECPMSGPRTGFHTFTTGAGSFTLRIKTASADMVPEARLHCHGAISFG